MSAELPDPPAASPRSDDGGEPPLAEHATILEQLKHANEQLVFATLRAEAAVREAEAATSAAEADRAALETEAELREVLISIIGHDLGNPLASFFMSAQVLLANNPFTAEVTDVLGGMQQSAARMRELVEHLIEFAQEHRGRGLSVRPQPANLEHICRAVIAELEVGRKLQGRFVCGFSGDLTGHWDPARIAQVVSNIAANAVDHGAPHSPVELRGSAFADSVQLEIVNAGAPLPLSSLPPGLVPFTSTTGAGAPRETIGLGLGLYISKELVRAHGGTFDVTSSAEDGTCFRICLPRFPQSR